jgi:hypothetical protein
MNKLNQLWLLRNTQQSQVAYVLLALVALAVAGGALAAAVGSAAGNQGIGESARYLA